MRWSIQLSAQHGLSAGASVTVHMVLYIHLDIWASLQYGSLVLKQIFQGIGCCSFQPLQACSLKLESFTATILYWSQSLPKFKRRKPRSHLLTKGVSKKLKLTLIYQKDAITEQLYIIMKASWTLTSSYSPREFKWHLYSNIQCLAIDTPNQNEHMPHIIGGKGLLWSKALETDLGSEFAF